MLPAVAVTGRSGGHEMQGVLPVVGLKVLSGHAAHAPANNCCPGPHVSAARGNVTVHTVQRQARAVTQNKY